MTVLLVFVTAAIFLTIDYFYGREKQRGTVTAEIQPVPIVHRHPSSMVDGFEVPDYLLYHAGHTWALAESPTLMRVGLDQFASRLIGRIERIVMPRRGQWIRQGQTIFAFQRKGSTARMVSPIEGTVVDVNDAVLREPALALRDPFGSGWLLSVQSPDAKTNFKNLIGGGMVRRWMEDAAARLREKAQIPAIALAQDGGIAVDDITRYLPEESWEEVTSEFFLT